MKITVVISPNKIHLWMNQKMRNIEEVLSKTERGKLSEDDKTFLEREYQELQEHIETLGRTIENW